MRVSEWHFGKISLIWIAWLVMLPVAWVTAPESVTPIETELFSAELPARFQPEYYSFRPMPWIAYRPRDETPQQKRAREERSVYETARYESELAAYEAAGGPARDEAVRRHSRVAAEEMARAAGWRPGGRPTMSERWAAFYTKNVSLLIWAFAGIPIFGLTWIWLGRKTGVN